MGKLQPILDIAVIVLIGVISPFAFMYHDRLYTPIGYVLISVLVSMILVWLKYFRGGE